MPIKTSCPHCSRSYALADTQQGKTVRCKGCNQTFVVRDGAAPRSAAPARDAAEDRPAPRPARVKKSGLPTWVLVVGGCGALVLLVGCLGGVGTIAWLATSGLRNKVTEENYKKIQMGMSEAEVKAILGEPTAVEDVGQAANRLGLGGNLFAMRVLVWKNGNNQITLGFRNDKVATMMSQFSSSRTVNLQTKG
jgi:predicted Zn finger-like uncharacterized protein